MSTCDCCGHEPSIGVASIPGVPMSIAWCVPCLRAGVIPTWVCSSVIVQCGGWEQVDEGYLELIAASLHYFDVDILAFELQVAEEMADFEYWIEQQDAAV